MCVGAGARASARHWRAIRPPAARLDPQSLTTRSARKPPEIHCPDMLHAWYKGAHISMLSAPLSLHHAPEDSQRATLLIALINPPEEGKHR